MNKLFVLGLMAVTALVPVAASATEVAPNDFQSRRGDSGHARSGDGGQRGGWRGGSGGSRASGQRSWSGSGNSRSSTPTYTRPAPVMRSTPNYTRPAPVTRTAPPVQYSPPQARNYRGQGRIDSGNDLGRRDRGTTTPPRSFGGRTDGGTTMYRSRPNTFGGRPDTRTDTYRGRPDTRSNGGNFRNDRQDYGRDRRDYRQDRGSSNWRDRGRYQRDYNGGRWNRTWRDNNRYDWQSYRRSNRHIFRLPRYYAPYGYSYGYRRYSIGWTLAAILFAPQYWIDDPLYYHLPPAYGDYRWVRYYDDALLVDIQTGQVVDVIYGIFW